MKMLLAMDFSRHAREAAKYVQHFPLPSNSDLYLAHVIEPQQWPGVGKVGDVHDLEQQLCEARARRYATAQRKLDRMVGQFRGRKLHVHPLILEGIPGAELLRRLEQDGMDLAILGTRGLSMVQRFLLGSVSEWVMNEAPCPVLIVHGRPRWATAGHQRPLHVMVATDGSSDAGRAAAFLNELPLAGRTELTMVHVVESSLDRSLEGFAGAETRSLLKKAKKAHEAAGFQILEDMRQRLSRQGRVTEEHLVHGHAGDEILKLVKRKRPDLLVVGSRGLTGLRRLLLGSVSHRLARHAPCSVLVVR